MFAKYWLTLKAGLFFFSPGIQLENLTLNNYLLAGFQYQEKKGSGSPSGCVRTTLLNTSAVNKRGDVWERALSWKDCAEQSCRGSLLDALGESANFLPLASIPERLAGSLESLVKYLLLLKLAWMLRVTVATRESCIFQDGPLTYFRRRERMIEILPFSAHVSSVRWGEQGGKLSLGLTLNLLLPR